MALKSFNRYVKKFILTQIQYYELIPRLLEYMNPDEHCKSRKNYAIFNIYYDTDNHDVIRHSIAKPYYTEKLRLRSYEVPNNLNAKVSLELKKKINGIVNKRRVVLTLDEAYKFINQGIAPTSNDYINKQVINEIQYYLEKNKVYISYYRKEFFAKNDRDFKLNFDFQIISRRDNLSLASGSFGQDILGNSKYLIEVKILGTMPLWFTKILTDLEIYNTHF